MKKRYVAVDAHWTKDGVMTPTAIYWVNPDGSEKRYEIDDIVGTPTKMNSMAGGYGKRYKIIISGNMRELFLEKDKWFLVSEKE